jgi:hypothetical protein
MEFHDAGLALHTDPLHASTNPSLWSFLNCDVRGDFCEASMWLASVVAAPPSTAAKVWKSTSTRSQMLLAALNEPAP